MLALAVATPPALAQRPAHPIARPRPPRPDQLPAPGRIYWVDGAGVAQAPAPGLFTVVAVDTRANTVQLLDDGGRSGTVLVDRDIFDLGALQAGDQVEVDFLVPDPGSSVIAAAALWKVEPVRP
jgi:hypothetical protein